MVNFIVDDEVGWREDGVDYVGFIVSDPNDMGEFHVNVEDEDGNAHPKVLNENHLPEGFVNYATAYPEGREVTESKPTNEPTVISKPQKQSLWPYVLFMVAGGALILNI